MRKIFTLVIVFLIIFINIKPLAYALNIPYSKIKFVLFCSAQNSNMVCEEGVCPLHNNKSASQEGSGSLCDTQIGCETTHGQETASSPVNENALYLPEPSFIKNYECFSFFALRFSPLDIQPLALSIEKPPQNII